MKYDANQPARRTLAAKLVALSEGKGYREHLWRNELQFDQALLTINAHFESIKPEMIEDYWDKWTDIHDALLIETDDRQRQQPEFMLALVGTAINEMRGTV